MIATTTFQNASIPFTQTSGSAIKNALLGLDPLSSDSHSTSQFRTRGTDTLTIGDQSQWIDRKTSLAFLPEIRKSYAKIIEMIGNLEQTMEAEIAEQYSELPQVQQIYLEKLNSSVYRLFVLTDNPHYDDGLMDQLLDCELNLIHSHQKTSFDVSYLGDFHNLDLNAIIPYTIQCIFSRG